jgi:hypothetical protein
MCVRVEYVDERLSDQDALGLAPEGMRGRREWMMWGLEEMGQKR